MGDVKALHDNLADFATARFMAVLGLLLVSASAHGQETTRYTYDALGRVRAVDTRAPKSKSRNDEYTYDAASNRVAVSSSGETTISTIFANSALRAFQQLISADGRFVLRFQKNGDLELLNENGNVVWSTQTSGQGGTQAVYQSDGNFVVYNAAGQPLWTSGTAAYPGGYVKVRPNGTVTVTDANGITRWSSAP